MQRNQPSLERRTSSAFTLWLRTGKWVPAQLADPALEVKFNPYHDPRNGQFTFKDGVGGTVAMTPQPKAPHQRAQGNGSWGSDFNVGGGGSAGGAGASGTGYWFNPQELAKLRRRYPHNTFHMASPGDSWDSGAATRPPRVGPESHEPRAGRSEIAARPNGAAAVSGDLPAGADASAESGFRNVSSHD